MLTSRKCVVDDLGSIILALFTSAPFARCTVVTAAASQQKGCGFDSWACDLSLWSFDVLPVSA